MSIELFFVYFVEVSMMMLGSILLWTQTKNIYFPVFYLLITIVTIAMGLALGNAASKIIPLIIIYTILAVEYSMDQMDQRINAILKKGAKPVKQSYKLIIYVVLALSGAASALLMSPLSELQSYIELIIAIVLVLLFLFVRLSRILFRRHDENDTDTSGQ